MRIRVVFSQQDTVAVPIAQNYFLASAIYDVLNAKPDYAQFLHDCGYMHQPSGRSFKLFVFSPLMCAQRQIEDQHILLGPGTIQWLISSPMIDFVMALSEGLLFKKRISIGKAFLPIDHVEVLPDPEFTCEMSFTCLSPIVATRSEGLGEHAHFCTHEDADFSERIRSNLVRKYELVHGSAPIDTSFEMSFDPDYIARRGGRVTKLIDIRGTQIRGVFAPFRACGSPELIKIGYQCGFGERGSMGFGCVEAQKVS
ncbi:MAG: CRISPR-associated endoribonuclease Cas6 [Armatimonadota bacterium]|nr:CRISPR-associated endoribonuclease Cas6 [Armatimonadota bacterium]